MKSIIFFPLALFLFSCSTPEQKLIKEVESHLISNLNDPKSYERISFNIKDSITNLEFEKKSIETNLKFSQEQVDRDLPILQQEKELLKLTNDMYDRDRVNKDQAEIDSLKKIINLNGKKLEELKTTKDNGSIKYIYFKAQFRAKNEFGALIVNEKDIVLDYNIKEIQIYN